MTFSKRFHEKISRVATQFLQHTCTIINYTTVDEDTDPTPSTTNNIPCLFLWKEVEVTDNRGTVVTKTPLLYLGIDVDVSEGSIVQNVLNRRGTNILESAKITTIDTTSEGGSESLKVAQLEGATV